MFGFFLDMFRGMQCPVCCRRGLFGVMVRAWSVARCLRCGARCIASRVDEQGYRKVTEEEWEAHAYEHLPAARSRGR